MDASEHCNFHENSLEVYYHIFNYINSFSPMLFPPFSWKVVTPGIIFFSDNFHLLKVHCWAVYIFLSMFPLLIYFIILINILSNIVYL